MDKGLKLKIGIVAAVLLVALVGVIPSIFYDYRANKTLLPEWWQKTPVLPQNNLVLGLDLQGGMDLVVSISAGEAVINELRHFKETIESGMRNDKRPFTSVSVDLRDQTLTIEYPTGAAMAGGSDYIKKHYPDLFVESGDGTLVNVYKLRQAAADDILKRSVNQVKEILARRMDAFGLREPEIVVQGTNRVRLQLPGVTDPTRIKKNIMRTAKLEFMIVEEVGSTQKAGEASNNGAPPPNMNLITWTNPSNPDQKVSCYFSSAGKYKAGPAPKGIRILPEAPEKDKPQVEACYALNEDLNVSGADLKDARPGFDSQGMQGSVVNFQFNMKGAQRFGKITGDNINRQLAVVLEDSVASAPRINDRIFDRGQISGTFTPQQATDLANVLRSGALDVSIKIEEERTVGASLGSDSIHSGVQAALWGSAAVVVFMVVYYSLGGAIANFALICNILLVLSALSLFGATLTLPGIAGIVLTVGMSVDANVLIFERAREELRNGKTPRSAMESGYDKALWTILDSNITTLIGALVLLEWGTGPIKGFAVTLSLGIISSVFTAVVVTRLVYDLMFYIRKDSRLRIGISTEPAAGSR